MKEEKEVKTKRLEFPDVDNIRIAFGNYDREWFKEILQKAEAEGFKGHLNNE